MRKNIIDNNLRLRPAGISDTLIIYKWAMDSENRNNSISGDKFSFEHHFHWFQQKLHDKNCRIFILESLFPIGQIRFEKKGDQWILSYSIDENFRNRGLGRLIVTMGLELMGTGKYIARVKKSNIPSIKIFQKLNFQETENELKDDEIINFIIEEE